MLSPSHITLENNGKILPQPDRENAFAGASGGGNDPGDQLSPVPASTAKERSEIVREAGGFFLPPIRLMLSR